eukprot:CAMPEP_0167756552 /NCGR_PEP_ID=MMETSP0110_2-20121227/9447_1 /TAXON_ID=629695 /ORGANISM="Gymnochlora sp., Strain CCMP2014" /LENGTH=434 /DNA_ID=CAMNT_0007642671 /DNA_START=20 /DNA_END=1324 /DNA_ORIENTATION=+
MPSAGEEATGDLGASRAKKSCLSKEKCERGPKGKICSKRSREEAKFPRSLKDIVKAFHQSYEQIVSVSLERYYKEELPGLEYCLKRDSQMFDYTIRGGQCFRGVLVVSATLELLGQKGIYPTKTRMQQIMCVAWALEVLQAAFLVADDIMDESHTRRGKACWHKVDHVHAYNDVFKLEHFAFYLLKSHLDKKDFVAIQEIFRGIILKTTFGQGLDLEYSSQIKSFSVNWDAQLVRKRLSMESYLKIVAYKTSYYTFHLPLNAALCLAENTIDKKKKTFQNSTGRKCTLSENKEEENEFDQKTWISRIGLELGQYFQVQDDFLDVYGNPKQTGKIGTDIEQKKLTWLMATAVAKADSKTLKELFAPSEDYVASVKDIFKKLELRKEYLRYESNICKQIRGWVDKAESVLPSKTILVILEKIHSSRIKKEDTEKEE